MNFLKIKLSVFVFLIPQLVLAHGESGTARIGKAFAVQEASEENGLRFSEAALKTMGIKTVSIDASGSVIVPKEALVRSQDKTAVFRLRDGFFKKIDLTNYKNSLPKLQHPSLRTGDSLVVLGAPLLHVAELEAFGTEEEEEDHHDHDDNHHEHEHEGESHEH